MLGLEYQVELKKIVELELQPHHQVAKNCWINKCKQPSIADPQLHDTLFIQVNDKKLISSTCKIEISFEDPIEHFVILGQTGMGILADRFGTIHFLNIISGDILESRKIADQPDDSERNTFAGLQVGVSEQDEESYWDIMIVLWNGRLIRLQVPVLENLDLFDKMTRSIKTEVVETGIISVLSLSFPNNPCLSFNNGRGSILLLISLDNSWTFWSKSDNQETCLLTEINGKEMFQNSIKGILHDSDSNVIIALDSHSFIYLFDLITLSVSKKIHLSGLFDIRLTLDIKGSPTRQILGLAIGENNETSVYWIDLNSLNTLLKVSCPHASSFSFPQCQFDTTLLMSSTISPITNMQKIQILDIVVSDPLALLSSWVKEGNHSKVLEFYDSPENKTGSGDIPLDTYYKLCIKHNSHAIDFKDSFERISDVNYLKNFAIGYSSSKDQSCDLEFLDLLNFAKRIVDGCQAEDAPAISKELDIAILRFITFEMMDPSVKSFWGDDWQTFRTSRMFSNIQYAIASKDIHMVLLFLKRHGQDIDEAELSKLILDIPRDFSISQITSLLDQFRILCNEDYDLREILDGWVFETVDSIESGERDLEKGLALLKWIKTPRGAKNCFSDLTPNTRIAYHFTASQESLYRCSKLYEKVEFRIKQLEDLLLLEKKHHLRITRKEYEDCGPSGLIMKLLDQASNEFISLAVQDHVIPYSAKHNIELDAIFADYCQTMLENSSGPFSQFSIWESRTLIILDYISAATPRIQTLLTVMRRTPVPWSETLNARITKTLKETALFKPEVNGKHSFLFEELNEQFKLMNLKRIMNERYGVKKFNVADITLAKRIIPFILKHVEVIEAIPDAMHCVLTYNNATITQVFVLRCQYLMNAGKIERLESLFKTGKEKDFVAAVLLDERQKKQVFDELDIWIQYRLHRMSQLTSKKTNDLFRNILKGAIVVAGFSSERKRLYEQCYQLSILVDQCISPLLMISDPKYCTNLLDDILKDDEYSKEPLEKALKVEMLLSLERGVVIFKSAVRFAKKGLYSKVLESCQEMENQLLGEVISSYVKELIYILLKGKVDSVESCKILMMMCRVALKNCSRAEVEDNLDLFSRFELCYAVLMRSDLGFYCMANAAPSADDFNFYSVFISCKSFSENALVLSSADVLSALNIFLQGPYPLDNDTGKTFIQAGIDVAQTCFSNRNFHLSLRFGIMLREWINELGNSTKSKFATLDCQISRIIDQSFENMLQALLIARDPDFKLSLGCMLVVSKDVSSMVFKSSLLYLEKDYKGLQRVASIGALAGMIWNNRAFETHCLDIIHQTKWMQELKRLGINVDMQHLKRSGVIGGEQHQRKLIPLLVQKTNLNLKLLLDFSSHYRIEDDVVFLNVIRHLCLHETDKTLALLSAIEKVQNKEKLIHLLTDCAENISPYDYEGLQFLFQQLVPLHTDPVVIKKNMLIIDILADYQRVVAPQEEELKTADQSNIHFEKSKCRIPFHGLIAKPLQTLSNEIADSTLSRLMPLAPLLGLNGDHYYEAIVQKKVKLLQQARSVQGSCNLKDITFADIKFLILKIKDFELALKTTVFVAGNFPRGQDRIAAYRVSLSLAERWLLSLKRTKDGSAELKEKASTACGKIKAMLGVAQTEFALQAHSLSFLDALVDNSALLLARLLSLSLDMAHVSISNLHEIATGVASRNEIDLDKFKLVLLQKWLTSTGGDAFDVPLEERVIFLVYGKIEWGMKHLLSFSNLSASKISSEARIRALSCLLRLSLLSECPKKMETDKIETQLRNVLYMNEFEAISISQTNAQFESADKHALARSLWLSKRETLAGLRLICRLCIDFSIPDPVLAENVLNLLLNVKDIDFVIEIMQRVMYTPLFDRLESFWNQALFEAVQSWLKLDPMNDSKKFIYYIDLIVKYPSNRDLISRLARFFETNDALSFEIPKTAVLLYGLYSLNLKSAVNFVLDMVPDSMLLPLVEHFKKTTLIGYIAQGMQDLVFNLINIRSCYETFNENPGYLEPFAISIIENDDLQVKFLALVKEGHIKQARDLVGFRNHL